MSQKQPFAQYGGEPAFPSPFHSSAVHCYRPRKKRDQRRRRYLNPTIAARLARLPGVPSEVLRSPRAGADYVGGLVAGLAVAVIGAVLLALILFQ